jgi:hypothetical protein
MIYHDFLSMLPRILVLLLLLSYLSYFYGQDTYECVDNSTVVIAENGVVSFTQTFITCLQNINDPLIFPGYFFPNVPSDPLKIAAQVALNNLIAVNEIDSTVTLDFFFRLYWTDPRLSMPALWQRLPIQLRLSGIDISQLVGVQDVQNGTQPGIWMPDIYFPDTIDQQVDAYLIRLYPGGYVEWSRHYTATFVQATFDYSKYPEDEQSLVVRFSSYGLNSSFLLMNPSPNGNYHGLA